MSQVTIRDLALKDRSAIKAMIGDTWDWRGEFIQSDEVVNATLGMYMNQIFYYSTAAKVAIVNDKIVGMVFGSVEGEVPKYRLMQEDGMEHTLTLLNASKDERKNVEEYLSKLHEAYDLLIEDKEELYGGCLEFLIVSKEARGLKIGKRLVDEMIAYFKSKNVEAFYLYSDTGCNYGFYEHNGFKRRAEREMNFEFSFGNYSEDAFLYEYQL